jgi:hypothetical protein
MMQRTGAADPHHPPDPYAEQWRRLEDALVQSNGALDTSVRESLAVGREIPGSPQPLAVYMEKVARHAYRVTDEDVQALLAAGYSQDQIFEATLCVALSAAHQRLQAGLGALRAASETGGTWGEGEGEGEE